MIRGLGSQNSVYQNNNNSQKTKNATTSSEQKASRLEEIKASIANGQYKVDLDALARKIAQDIS